MSDGSRIVEGRTGQERTGRIEKSHATLILGTCENGPSGDGMLA